MLILQNLVSKSDHHKIWLVSIFNIILKNTLILSNNIYELGMDGFLEEWAHFKLMSVC